MPATAATGTAATIKLQRNKVIYVLPSQDGIFDGRTYIGTGASVADMFVANLRPYAAKVQLATEGNIPQDAYYVVKPTILHWEPRAAAWSGISTKVEINVSITNATGGVEVINKSIQVSGRNVTFVSQSADALAQYVIKDFCSSIF